jgi:hypothetical protein
MSSAINNGRFLQKLIRYANQQKITDHGLLLDAMLMATGTGIASGRV